MSENKISNIQKYELSPWGNQKSFYGKAIVKIEGNKTTLQSYQTDVAVIENGICKIKDTYSQTTLKHIKSFLAEFGFQYELTSKQILEIYK